MKTDPVYLFTNPDGFCIIQCKHGAAKGYMLASTYDSHLSYFKDNPQSSLCIINDGDYCPWYKGPKSRPKKITRKDFPLYISSLKYVSKKFESMLKGKL